MGGVVAAAVRGAPVDDANTPAYPLRDEAGERWSTEHDSRKERADYRHFAVAVKAKKNEAEGFRSWLVEEGASALLARLPRDSCCSVSLIEECICDSPSHSRAAYDALIEVWSAPTAPLCLAAFTHLRLHSQALHAYRMSKDGGRRPSAGGAGLIGIWPQASLSVFLQGSCHARRLELLIGCATARFASSEEGPMLSHGGFPPAEIMVLEPGGPPAEGSDLPFDAVELEQYAAEMRESIPGFQLFKVRRHVLSGPCAWNSCSLTHSA